LRYLHCDKRIVHRDLTPNNVMLGESDKVTLSELAFASYQVLYASLYDSTLPAVNSRSFCFTFFTPKEYHRSKPSLFYCCSVWQAGQLQWCSRANKAFSCACSPPSLPLSPSLPHPSYNGGDTHFAQTFRCVAVSGSTVDRLNTRGDVQLGSLTPRSRPVHCTAEQLFSRSFLGHRPDFFLMTEKLRSIRSGIQSKE